MPQTVTVAPALDAAAIANAGIVPTPGTWSFGVTSVQMGTGCPEGMGQVMTAAMFPVNTLIVPEGPFDIREIIDSTGSKIPASAVVTNPEPNQYVIEISEQGTVVHYELNVVEAGQIDGTMTMNAEGCSMNFTVSMTHK